MSTPTVAATVPLRRNERAIPEIVLEAGYQRGLDLADLDLVPVSPADRRGAVRRKLGAAAGLMLTGGEDLDPGRYGEEPRHVRTVSPERDELEFDVLERALERSLPVLAICRGMQLLNVRCGGTLWQDVGLDRDGEGEEVEHERPYSVDKPAHRIDVSEPELLEGIFTADIFEPNSSHHQGLRDLGDGLVPVCRSPDGLIEAVELRDGDQWAVGVQWHPERMLREGSGTHRRLFRRFGRVVRRRAAG